MEDIRECKHKNYYYECKKLRLLQYLLEKGFEPEKTIPDPTNWRYKHWLFVNEPSLEDAIDEFFAKKYEY